MGFNADGTYTDPDHADGNGAPAGTPGTGINGEKWDPNTNRWIPLGAPGNPRPSAPEGVGGWSNLSNENYGDGGRPKPVGGGEYNRYDTTGKVGSPGAYGGYTGRMVDDGNGGVKFDGTHSGRQDAVDRLSGLAGAAAAQQAYQNDYSQADKFAGLGQNARGYEQSALGLAGETARGNNLQSMALGQGMLQQGLQAQQAGAASTRGGSLAAAAAMRQQASGAGAFMAQGQTQLDAQRAAEMATGRDMYQQQVGAMRAGDAQAQGLDQSQAIQQMQNELQQRQLGQKGSMGYDSLGQDVNIGANNAALGQHEQNAGIEDKSMQRHQGKLDQGQGWVGDAASTAGSFGAGASGLSGGGSKSADPDPYSKAVSNSDVRGKTNIRGLASVARKGMR